MQEKISSLEHKVCNVEGLDYIKISNERGKP